MKTKSLFVLLCTFVLSLACSPKSTMILKNDTPLNNQEMSILTFYKDGNNNTWEIKESSVVYIPVSENESSSGEYSGGKRRNISINSEKFSKIQALAQAAIADSSSHLTIRKMGSAQLLFTDKKIILDMNSKSKGDIELFLKSL